MIVFRQLDEGYKDPGIHWHVEYFGDPPEHLFPIGTAYVVAINHGGRAAAQLNVIVVADAWRRQGIATKIIRACQERWPGLQTTSVMGAEGEGLLRKVMPDHSEDDDGET